MPELLIGTGAGLVEPDGSAPREPGPGPVRMFGDLVISAGEGLWRRSSSGWNRLAAGRGLLCALDTAGGALVGTAAAHLLRLDGDHLVPVDGFEQVPGRATWHTPWGGPPDTRSLAVTGDGVLLANVHVGGIARSDDDGRTWSPTIDVDADVHQVLGVPGRAGLALAAAAVGLARSADAGRTWSIDADGLHASYCRAVAVAGDTVLVSASEGPRGARSAIYRTGLDGGGFERCTDWLDGNIDTFCLVARGPTVVYGTSGGRVLRSDDAGGTWTTILEGRAPVTSVALV